MKMAKIVSVAALASVMVVAGSWAGCQRGGSPTPRAVAETGPAPQDNDTASEHKTVIKTESSVPEQRAGQLQQWMQEFQREGWAVLSVSKPQPQPDGTVRREYRLKRARL
jgi:hypothetical protein